MAFHRTGDGFSRRLRSPRVRSLGFVAGAFFFWNAGAAAQTPAPSATAKPSSPRTFQSLPERKMAPPSGADAVLFDSLDLIEREYFDQGISREELVEAAMRGIVEHLNRRAARQGHPPVNALLSRREMSRLSDSMSGRVVGIGVYAKPGTEGIDVLHVFEDSPAGKAGVRRGDRIIAIDDRAIAPLLSTVGVLPLDMLRGEEGSAVKLTLVREAGTEHAAQLDVKLVRRAYAVSPVSARIFDNDVGYVKIASFTRGAADDVGKALLDLKAEKAWGVILDLRGNPGGALEEANAVASMFIEPGTPLMQIQGRGEPQNVTSHGEVFWPAPLPVAVLVDSGTSSAAEALASSLQTTERALLVGERTAGRGLGESIFTLPSGGALRLATARYASALGDAWIQRGLTPDSAVLSLALEPDDDPPLRAALTIMGRFRQTVQLPTLTSDPMISPVNVQN